MIDSLAFYITLLRKNFTKYCTERLNEVGVSYGQLYIIIYIGKKMTCSPSEISQALKLDAGHLNRTINKLVDNGFLMQTQNEKDKRAKVLCLTEEGEKIFHLSQELFHDWDEQILSLLTLEERQQIKDLLKKITIGNMTYKK